MTPLVFITGASSGIGQALALQYYREGWSLALVARRVDELTQWAQAQSLDPARWRIYRADVSEVDAITEVGRRCIAEQGLPEVVIANAGISIGMDTAIYDDLAVMQRIYATNNVGLAATFQPFVQPMRERRRGTLVGIASVAGIRGLPGHGAYCSSKAAVISYCESLRGECRADGVQVVTIAPGYIDTPLTRENRYSMPFLMKPDDFARRAFKAISAGARLRFIPWQMGVVAGVMRVLPGAWFDRLLAGRPRKHRQGE
ncbi:SDR family oxidoreductase [Roseateles amylovorans]|uniref:SDR family oxidoreductase n=1 Tax=Roseateles amylovorans TaxID=2978473 RepID=A0ABY6AYU0_9BURK|nr:SDR family oxidoreductase [Roseateles amylovorans]UXH78346.1 SDR family oxidoreductase [Roseateles amylovorans]